MVSGDGALAHVVGNALERGHVAARFCRDGADALQLIEQEHPALVLIDGALPSGALALCRALRDAPNTTGLPLVVLAVAELLARINALRRRAVGAAQVGVIKAGSVEMDLDRW